MADSLQTSAFKPLVYKNIAALYNERGEYEEANSYISEAMRDIEVEESLYSIYFLKGDIMNHLNKKIRLFIIGIWLNIPLILKLKPLLLIDYLN